MGWACGACPLQYWHWHGGEPRCPWQEGRGRPRKTWAECVKTDIRDCGLSAVDPQDRVAWRAAVRLCRVGTTPATGKGVPR